MTVHQLSGLFGGGSAAWNLAAGLTQPLFNAGRTEANVELTEARFRAGITAYLDVLDAQRELFAAEQATVRTRAALLTSAALLWKALGGGG